MKAIILAGGEGTRLRPLTYTTPKPLIDVQGQTLTEHVFDILKKYNITDIILSLGYKAEKIKQHFSDGAKFRLKINYLIEEKPMGTAGPLVLMKQIGCEEKEDFIVINGDNLFALDLNKMLEFHISHDGIATIALTKVDDVTHYGIAKMDDDKIVDFIEKPAEENAPSNYANSGYYIFKPEIYKYIPDNDFVMFEKDVFPKLASDEKLYGFKSNAQWFDTGTFKRYEDVKNNWQGPK
ncbi:nucleotidyltransferase family protein [Patescibacteria group bacterium]|nr:nucleotidyltransferase family protein [Patescibacteria group bacterium]